MKAIKERIIHNIKLHKNVIDFIFLIVCLVVSFYGLSELIICK